MKFLVELDSNVKTHKEILLQLLEQKVPLTNEKEDKKPPTKFHVVGKVEKHGKLKDKIKVNDNWYKVENIDKYPLNTMVDTYLEKSEYKRG